jgi:uncharacterized caspase-like protein
LQGHQDAGSTGRAAQRLARYGRVLVLLDACHSGGTAIAAYADALRTNLAAANVTVVTSSKGSETSVERESWQHGAFTKALLDSFNDGLATRSKPHRPPAIAASRTACGTSGADDA